MLKQFTKTYYTDSTELGNTPAAVNIATGELYINKPLFSKLPKEQKVFILLHELGHYKLQTFDEIKADAFAWEAYKKLGYSLKQSVYALSENLTGKTTEHYKRVQLQIQRAKTHDMHKLTNFTGAANGQIDPSDPTGNTVLVDSATFQSMVQQLEEENAQLEQEYAELDAEIAQLNKEINSIDSQLSSLVKNLDDAKRVNDEACASALRAEIAACNTRKNKKKRANCRESAAAANRDCINSAYDTQGEFDTKYTVQVKIKADKQNRRNERVRRKSEVKKARQERKSMLAEARAYKKITMANGKNYKMQANANANNILAGQGIDSRGNMMQSGMQGISSVADSVASIFGGGSAAHGGAATAPAQDSTMMILVVVIVIAGAFFMTQQKKK